MVNGMRGADYQNIPVYKTFSLGALCSLLSRPGFLCDTSLPACLVFFFFPLHSMNIDIALPFLRGPLEESNVNQFPETHMKERGERRHRGIPAK